MRRSYLLTGLFLLSLLAWGCSDDTTTGEECGNGKIDQGETCDPPDSCPADCDDSDPCTEDSMSGSAETCDVACEHDAVTECSQGDGCCPADCNAKTDSDCQPFCGNGVIEEEETCDPPASCPEDCDDGNSCTEDSMTGDANDCDVACVRAAVDSCTNDDGCCPAGCDLASDNDCSETCGNGEVEEGETCDPPDTCPASCDDSNACTTDIMTGSADNCNVACSHTGITECLDDDDCCPAGCNSNSDNDCSVNCGNDIVEDGETCDPPDSCPADCDDSEACTIDLMTGSPENCNVACSHNTISECLDDDGCCVAGCNANLDNDCPAVCGNEIVEPGETCDPPATCPADCDDGDPCTDDSMTGSAADCDALCPHDAIGDCLDDDGCCPPGCDSSSDNDCEPPPEICTGGADEDGDGFVDCDDLDCFDDPSCSETCPAVADTVACGGSLAGDTSTAGNTLSWYNCLPWDETGGELVYDFSVAEASEVVVDLAPDPGVDVDIFVLEADCQQDACTQYGDHQVEFTAMSGTTYYLVVDSYEDRGGPYTIDVNCTPIAEDCNNGVDDDFDTLIDCEDNDCNGDQACPGNGNCHAQFPVHCNDTRWSSTTNDNQRPTDVIDAYSCGVWDESGPEVAWEFVAPRDGQVSVSIEYEPAERNLDLFVLQGTCDPDQCIHQADHSVTFDSTNGTTYFFVIDGRNGDFGNYTLRITCQEACDNNLDDDGDGFGDCADDDCHGDPACEVEQDRNCITAVDEDLDNLTDCDDPECAGTPWCPLDGQCDTANLNIWCGGEFSGTTTAWGSTDVVDVYSCTGDVLAGPEQALVYNASGAGQATVTLTSESSAQLKVSALEDSCEGTSCIGHGDASTTFDVQDGHTYYLVVDAPEGVVGAFTMQLDCQFEDCFDMVDNDGDDLIDCDDPDCQGTAWCPAGICEQDGTIACGDTLPVTITDQEPNQVMYYPSCMGGMPNPDGEAAYLFTTDTPVSVMANMMGGGGMGWILALEGECSGETCLMMGGAALMFNAVPGKDYYIVIDGLGDFNLSVACSPAVEVCVNGEDDDGDGAEDCADDDCIPTQACPADGLCVPRPEWWSIGCDGMAFGSTAQWGNTDVIDSYDCTGWDATGPEVVYTFVADEFTTATVNLSHAATIDLDLYLLQHDCAPDACIAAGSDSIEFEAIKDKTYYLVVEGANGDAGPFTLDVSCTP